MRIRDIAVGRGPDPLQPVRLSATVDVETDWLSDDPPFRVWYDVPEAAADFVDPANADPFLAAFLLPAMRAGEPLTIDGAISSRLRDALPTLQAFFAAWDPDYHVVQVDVGVRPMVVPARPPSGRALFFSGGIASTYVLAKNLRDHPDDADTLTHLVVVEGFDIYLWERARFPPLLESVRRVADHVGVTAWPVTTNMRDFTDRIVDWMRAFHGAALASVALGTGAMLRTARIAAWATPRYLLPMGSHPATDPLWSSEHLTFFHDGMEATRVEKAATIAQFPYLLEGLRICTTGEETLEYNCGRCEKCVRTQLELYVVGALHHCRTLPQRIDLDALRVRRIEGVMRLHYEDIADHLGSSPFDLEIRAALEATGALDAWAGAGR